MNKTTRHAILGCVLAGLALTPASADRLTDAQTALKNRNYPLALARIKAYYNAGGKKRYRADFIRAASDCRISNGAPWARQEMAALRSNYWLNSVADGEVTSWLKSCVPPPPRPPKQADYGDRTASTVSAVTNEPEIASASEGAEPPRLAPMTPLAEQIGYIGGDFASPRSADAAACQRLCQTLGKCRAMTWDANTRICWLKDRIPKRAKGGQFTSSRKL